MTTYTSEHLRLFVHKLAQGTCGTHVRLCESGVGRVLQVPQKVWVRVLWQRLHLRRACQRRNRPCGAVEVPHAAVQNEMHECELLERLELEPGRVHAGWGRDDELEVRRGSAEAFEREQRERTCVVVVEHVVIC